MVLSRTRVAVLVTMVVVLALGIGLMGAVGFASPKDNDDGHHNNDKGRSTLTVLTKTRKFRVVDPGPKGASQGDMRVVNAPLYNESGKKKVGSFDMFCVLTDSGEKVQMTECVRTYTLVGGEITSEGASARSTLNEVPLTDEIDATSGGTEDYIGVRGEVRFEIRANKVIATFHFVE